MKITKIRKFQIFILFIIGFVIHLSRLNLGFAFNDEVFYLAIPLRLFQGDMLLIDEWHLTQLASFIISPLFTLYSVFFKNYDGIVLFFRFIYILILTGSSMLAFYLLKEIKLVIRTIIVLLFYLFVPFNIMQLSYNSIGLICAFLLTCLFLWETKYIQVKYITIGIMLSLLVLCNPFMISTYFIYFVLVIVFKFLRISNDFINIKNFCYTTIGSCLILIAFLLFVLPKASINEIVNNLPYILSDNAHSPKNFKIFIWPFIKFVKSNLLFFIPFFVLFTLGLFKKMRKFIFTLIEIEISIFIIYLAIFKLNDYGYSAIMLPLSILGLVVFIYSKFTNLKVFLFGWGLGFIYVLCLNLGSNNGIYVISQGLVISSLFSIYLIYDYDHANWNKYRKGIFVLLISSQFFSQIYVLNNHFFWENGRSSLVYEIKKGPLKGIITSEYNSVYYDENSKNIIELKKYEAKNILFFKNFTVGYLITSNFNNAGFSPWLADSIEDLEDDKLVNYWQIYPNKIADIIYVDTISKNIWNEKQWYEYAEKHDYSILKFDNGAISLIKPSLMKEY